MRDHGSNGEELHLCRKVRDGYVRYRGQYDCAGYEWRDDVPDGTGDLRRAIVFQLVPHAQLEGDEPDGESDIAGVLSDDLNALRDAALEAPPEGAPPADSRRRVYRRSRAVRRYVLLRAQGKCEGCGQRAPFVRPDGSPYLQPHHIRRRSDAGPDHPRWVIALCPSCHLRVHHGIDGEVYNEEVGRRLGLFEVA